MKYVVLIILSSLLTACSVYSPNAGHEVVLVEKPILIGHGGVDLRPREDRPFVLCHDHRGHRRQYAASQKFEVELPRTP